MYILKAYVYDMYVYIYTRVLDCILIYIHIKFFGVYYLLIFILLVKIILDKIKENKIKIHFLKSHIIFKYVFFCGLFIVSLISIIIPKTNFSHLQNISTTEQFQGDRVASGFKFSW